MTENELFFAAKEAVKTLENHKKTLALAESCTGVLVSKLITDVSGASAVYEGGVCSYSNSVKMKILGVKEETLRTFGAVSENTAREMSQGVRKALGGDENEVAALKYACFFVLFRRHLRLKILVQAQYRLILLLRGECVEINRENIAP